LYFVLLFLIQSHIFVTKCVLGTVAMAHRTVTEPSGWQSTLHWWPLGTEINRWSQGKSCGRNTTALSCDHRE